MSNPTFAYWRPTLLLIGCLTSLAVTRQASAADVQPPTARTVNYADLDLTRPAGIRVLRTRVDSAIRLVCANPSRSLADQARQRICVTDAHTRSDAQVRVAVTVARDRLEAQAARTYASRAR